MKPFVRTLTSLTLIFGLGSSPFAIAQSGPDAEGARAGTRATLHGLEMAGRLAGLHLWLGITADQEDAWQRFTTAALALPPSAGEMPSVGASQDAFEAIDRAAELTQAFARRVATLREAALALRGVMKPEQVSRANQAFGAVRAAMREHWAFGGRPFLPGPPSSGGMDGPRP